ncbi:MAG: hypothetical protein ACKVWR_07840 [Acidimicrobiales bacterium]
MTRRFFRRLAVALAAAAIAVALDPAAARAEPARTHTNHTLALAQPGGDLVVREAWMLRRVSGRVDAANSAVASASCDGCRAVAAAIQIILLERPEAPLQADNLAVAATTGCERCETSAAAHQLIVIGDGVELQLSRAAQDALRRLRREFAAAARTAASPAELAPAVDAVAERVAAVLAADLRAVGPDAAAAFSFDGGPAPLARIEHRRVADHRGGER